MQEFISNSELETINLAKKLGSVIEPGTVVAFYGGLGAGKTTFTKGLALALNAESDVSSPTFAIVNDYGGNPHLYHFDMYRVETWDDLYASGFFDYYDSGAVLAVEWSENIENALPDNTIKVMIEMGKNDTQRYIKIDGGPEL